MRTSCIRLRAKARIAVLYEDFLEICNGNMLAAMLLAILVYWTDTKIGKKEKSLWIWKSHTDFQEDLMFDKPGMKPPHRTTVKAALDLLKEKQFIKVRKNPKMPLDQTRQYLVEQEVIQAAIDALPPIVVIPTLESQNTDNGMSNNQQSLSENQQSNVGISTSNTNDYSTVITDPVTTEEEDSATFDEPDAAPASLPGNVSDFLSESAKLRAVKAAHPSQEEVQHAFEAEETIPRGLPRITGEQLAARVQQGGDAHGQLAPSQQTSIPVPPGDAALTPVVRAAPADGPAHSSPRSGSFSPATAPMEPGASEQLREVTQIPGAAQQAGGKPFVTREPHKPAATQPPLSLRDEAPRPLTEKQLRARYEAHVWDLIEGVRKERGLKPPTWGKAWKALHENQQGIDKLLADEVSDADITAGYQAMLDSKDAWLRENFNVLAFWKRLQGLLDGRVLPANNTGKPRNVGRSKTVGQPEVDLDVYGIEAIMRRQPLVS